MQVIQINSKINWSNISVFLSFSPPPPHSLSYSLPTRYVFKFARFFTIYNLVCDLPSKIVGVCVFEAFNVCTKAHLKNKHFSWCKWCLLPSITLEPIQQQHDLRTLATTTKNRRIKPVIILGRSYNRDEECLRVYRPCAVCSNRNEINFLNEFPV